MNCTAPCRQPNRFFSIWGFVFISFLCLFAPAWGQVGEAVINITDIEVKELTNAVLVTIKADGTLQLRMDFLNLEKAGVWKRNSLGEWHPEGAGHRFYFWIPNARSKLASSYIRVEKYPLSHIEVKLGAPQYEIDNGNFRGEYALQITFETYTDTVLWWNRHEGWMDWWEGEDQKSMYLLFVSDRQTKPTMTPPVESAFEKEVQPELTVREENGVYTVHALNAGLQDVVKELSFASRRTVTLSAGTERRITLSLRDQTLEDLLQSLARSYSLIVEPCDSGYILSDGAVSIASSYSSGTVVTRRMQYLKARAAYLMLPNFLVPYMRIDDINNTVSIAGSKPLVEHTLQQLDVLDQPSPHVRIDVRAMEFSSTEDAENALAFRLARNRSFLESDASTGDIVYERIGGISDEVQARLTSLVAKGQARVLSQSHLTVSNGKDASMFLGQGRTIIIEYDRWQWWEGRRQRIREAQLDEVNIGTSLYIEPTACDGDQIIVSIYLQVDTLAEVDPKSGLPVVAARSSYSALRIKDGDTIVLSGLQLALTDAIKQKIPVLGDLPLIGGLFRSHRKNARDSEFLIFVTVKKV